MYKTAFAHEPHQQLDASALPWLKDSFDPEREPLQQVLTFSMAL